MFRLARIVLAALALAAIGGCSKGPYDVEVTFAEGVGPTDVRFVELLILPECPSEEDVASGQAPSGTIVAGVGLAQASAGDLPSLPTVRPGRYGLYARGFNVSCTAVAAGCIPVSIEAKGGGALSVELAATTPFAACGAEICSDGRCVYPDDGGMGSDGSIDVDACLANPCPADQYCTDLPPPAPDGATGRTCTPVTSCGVGQYETKAPTPTSNRVCTSCAICNSGQYETMACADGNAPQNRACTALSNCSVGSYQSTAPTPTSDRLCSPCTTCGSTQYETTACANGNSAQDRLCAPLLNCTTGEYESVPPTATSNRACATCVAPCGLGFYQSQECANGNAPQNRICSPCDMACNGRCSGPTASDCTTCPADQYWNGASCVSTTQCGANEYQTVAPTANSDRQCATCTACTASQYETQACANGNTAQNRICAACDPSCATCDGAGSTHCTSCRSGGMLASGQCTYTCTLTASADGTSWNYLSDGSNGTATELETTFDGTSYHRAFVRFDVASGTCAQGGSIPAGSTILSATLEMTRLGGCGTCGTSHDLRRITSAWTESTIPAGAGPSVSGAASATFAAPGTNSVVGITSSTVISDVQSFLSNPSTSHGWRIAQTSGSGNNVNPYTWGARENATSTHRPRLVITYR